MGISVFPSGGGEFITNDFVADMNNTENNVIDLGRSYASGSYDVSLASGDTSFDIYALDADGVSVGYTNNATLITSDAFTSLVILGVASDEKITFAFSGASNNATSEGNAVGAGAYLESINPSDLPTIDDTANVIGGNFASDVEIYFESGTVSIEAKQVARADSTALIITRPDNLDAALDPWDVKAINPGVTPPTGSNAHILAGTVDAGAVPVWVTTSPLPAAPIDTAYSATVLATDADGAVSYSVSAGSLPTGLSINSTTGVISGTPTVGGLQTFTLAASDDGGNESTREFDLNVLVASGGTISQSGNFTVHTFEASGDFEAFAEITDVEYIILAGGGGGGRPRSTNLGCGGGGGGGLLSSISGFASGEATTALSAVTVPAGTVTVTVGAGGAGSNNDAAAAPNGSDSSFGTFGTAIGGGGGGAGSGATAGSGGSGGGGNANIGQVGNGTTGQGFAGGFNSAVNSVGGGGGGTSSQGDRPNSSNTPSNGGDGTANFLDQRGWGAGGGAGGANTNVESLGGGSDGNDQTTYAGNGGYFASNNTLTPNSAVANFGGGGGGGGASSSTSVPGASGASGQVVIRYEA